MNHIKIIDRDGTKIKLNVWCGVGIIDANYDVSISICAKGKRTFYDTPITNPLITPDDIYQAKIEMWQKLMPQNNSHRENIR